MYYAVCNTSINYVFPRYDVKAFLIATDVQLYHVPCCTFSFSINIIFKMVYIKFCSVHSPTCDMPIFQYILNMLKFSIPISGEGGKLVNMMHIFLLLTFLSDLCFSTAFTLHLQWRIFMILCTCSCILQEANMMLKGITLETLGIKQSFGNHGHVIGKKYDIQIYFRHIVIIIYTVHIMI